MELLRAIEWGMGLTVGRFLGELAVLGLIFVIGWLIFRKIFK